MAGLGSPLLLLVTAPPTLPPPILIPHCFAHIWSSCPVVLVQLLIHGTPILTAACNMKLLFLLFDHAMMYWNEQTLRQFHDGMLASFPSWPNGMQLQCSTSRKSR